MSNTGKLVDMTGQVVKGWRIVERAKSTLKGAMWWCSCERCEGPRLISGNALRQPRKISHCRRCYEPRSGGRQLLDITGEVRGTWRVLARVVNPKTRWRCSCVKCGFEREVDGSQLKAEPPPCAECKKIAVRPPPPAPVKLERVVAPSRFVVPFNSDEQGTPARCSVCRSMALFLRGRCGQCGAAWSADRLPHVDGRRCG